VQSFLSDKYVSVSLHSPSGFKGLEVVVEFWLPVELEVAEFSLLDWFEDWFAELEDELFDEEEFCWLLEDWLLLEVDVSCWLLDWLLLLLLEDWLPFVEEPSVLPLDCWLELLAFWLALFVEELDCILHCFIWSSSGSTQTFSSWFHIVPGPQVKGTCSKIPSSFSLHL